MQVLVINTKNTVKATVTKPVLETFNGNLKKPNDVADKQNGLRNRCQLALIMLLTICFMLLFIYGCGQKYYVSQKADLKTIKKIAVLPFENFSTEEIAGEKIRRIVIAELISRGIEVVEPGEVSRLIKDIKIKSISMIKLSDIKEIGNLTGSDAVMTGSVEYYGISRGININYPEVTINLRLIETSTGNVLWSIRKTSEGPDFWMRHFGSEGKTLSETAGEVVRDAIKTIF